MKLVSHLPKPSFWLYLGPVLNVLLVLLIFLLLSSSFVVQSGVGVTLPESGSRLSSFHHARVITVTPVNQAVYLDGQRVTLQELREGLQDRKNESRVAIIHADEMAPHGWVQKVANVPLSLGYRVGYATSPLAR